MSQARHGTARLTWRKQKGTVSTLTPTMLFTTFMIRPQLEPAAAAIVRGGAAPQGPARSRPSAPPRPAPRVPSATRHGGTGTGHSGTSAFRCSAGASGKWGGGQRDGRGGAERPAAALLPPWRTAHTAPGGLRGGRGRESFVLGLLAGAETGCMHTHTCMYIECKQSFWAPALLMGSCVHIWACIWLLCACVCSAHGAQAGVDQSPCAMLPNGGAEALQGINS